MSLPAEIGTFLDEQDRALVDLRRHLHAHPELSWVEHETTATIAGVLQEAGLAPGRLETDTGLVVELGRGDGPVVALRADIDALPLEDEKDVPYRSTVAGVSHACGHDVHTSAAVGAALALDRILEERGHGRVRVVFQPAEEAIPGGASVLYQTALLDDVAVIYALHCDPTLEVGHVGLRAGPITSAADRVIITLQGPGGHTARPHRTADLVLVAAKVINETTTAVSRLTDGRDGATLVFGSVEAGHAPNVIPTHAELRGTMRVRGRAAWEAAPEIIERIVGSVADPYGAQWKLDYTRGSPPVDNDRQAVEVMSQAVVEALGPDGLVPTDQSVGNEDFSWFLERVPGAYARLGVAAPATAGTLDLHAGAFDIDERAIAVGARVLVGTALAALDRLA
jgi:amidohydrolase